MKISDRGLDLIVAFEGSKIIAYPDPATGGQPWTIGVGHTRGVRRGDVCTEAEAMEWLREDCSDAETCIEELVEPELSQNQYDALVSFIFNVGCGNFRTSTMLTLINSGHISSCAPQFLRFNKAAGKVMAGLTRRRQAEADLFSEEQTA